MSTLGKKSQKSTILNTNTNGKIGQDKCPKCGSTYISYDFEKQSLVCEHCLSVIKSEKLEGLIEDISTLKGFYIAKGGETIDKSVSNILTYKCSSCGAEVVVDTSKTTQNRCHWCRNMLSINMQIPNGAIPDLILPFKLTKKNAKGHIENFVRKRNFYANKTFKEQFCSDNIMGVFLPYLVVDINSKIELSGKGEHQTRSYFVGPKERRELVYDADVYAVGREFDLTIEGLTIESSSDKIKNNSNDKTNNIINSIMPFDIENCIKFNSYYLNGFSSEKRDIDIHDVKKIVSIQSKDVARFVANSTLSHYDRGVRWDKENLEVIGEQWKTAYLPLWLYSYYEVSGNKSVLHYVAVNARTSETMGSIPIDKVKLFIVSSIIEFFSFLIMLSVDSDISFLFLSFGFIYYTIIYASYRNGDKRHYHEAETVNNIRNLKKSDKIIDTIKGSHSSFMSGSNNHKVNGTTIK